MNKDKVVTEDNYKQVVLKRMIALCWVLLGICFVVKLFGGNFFAFVGESAVVEYIAKHEWLLCIVQFIFYYIQSMLYFGIFIKHKPILTSIVSIILFICKYLLDIIPIFLTISLILEVILLIGLPIIFKHKWYNVVVIFILLTVFQVVSLFTKNIGIISFPYEHIVGFVFMIDYYIMLALVFLYSRKGDINFMKLGFLFLSSDVTQLEAYKKVITDKHIKKVAKLNIRHDNKVAKIDAKIKKINEKK